MKADKFNMCAGTVTLDLSALKDTLGAAIGQARNELEREGHAIREALEDAFRAGMNGNNQDNYHGLCLANTHREYLVRAAEQYAAAVHAYFHICEAIKRDEVRIVKE